MNELNSVHPAVGELILCAELEAGFTKLLPAWEKKEIKNQITIMEYVRCFNQNVENGWGKGTRA